MQSQGAVLLRGGEDFVDIPTHKLLVDEALGGIPLRLPEHPADGVNLLAEVLLGELLLFQVVDLMLRLADLPVALLVHGEEIPVGKLAGGVVAQELAFLLLGQLDLLT